MDSSQSSDVFSNLTNQSCTVITNTLDVNNYDSLLSNTKTSLCQNISALANSSFYDYFASLLEDCRLCLSQALKLLSKVLLESNASIHQLECYLQDAITILHLLNNFIKSIVESYSITGCTMKTFPITTGQIIMDVFEHCKNSVPLYGVHLTSVQELLKNLFRTCHELQLTYLMVLEKHFVFDLTAKDELDTLVTALNINLHIGEVVQTLDVKTMAEQWKAYTTICEKYSNYLMDTSVYQDCSILLSTMVLNSIKTSLEMDQDDKPIIRSLKVTNFTIKILLKMCTIFKHSLEKPYQCIVDLLINIQLYNPAYLKNVEGKSTEFVNIMLTNVINPADLLLKELLNDESFVNVILNYNVNNLRQRDDILGLICLIANVMKSVTQTQYQYCLPKNKIISNLFELLPDCNVWINMGLQFEIDVSQNETKSVGLFEYLLIFTTSLALKMNCEEYFVLEKNMCEALLGVDSSRALFASNLWIVLSRIIKDKELLFCQLISLCHIFQKLENMRSFPYSPQKVHISSTIAKMFEIADVEDRIKLYKQFNPLINEKNTQLWTVFKINKLPFKYQRIVEKEILEKCNTGFQNFSSEYPYEQLIDLVKAMKLAATCSFNALEGIEEMLMEAWSKACPKNLQFPLDVLDVNTMWFLDYVEALVSLTRAMKYTVYASSSHMVKILHVLSGLIQLNYTELKLLLMDLLCELAAHTIHDENKTIAAKISYETIKTLIQNSDAFVRKMFYRVVRKYDNKYLYQTVFSIVSGQSLLEEWQQNMKSGKYNILDNVKLKEHLILINNYKYRHKCVKSSDTAEVNCGAVTENIPNSCSSNFDFADIDSLFDNESDGEPATKKVKFETTDVEAILDRLEQDTSLLYDIKENIRNYKHKKRIRLLYEKLISIVDKDGL